MIVQMQYFSHYGNKISFFQSEIATELVAGTGHATWPLILRIKKFYEIEIAILLVAGNGPCHLATDTSVVTQKYIGYIYLSTVL